MKRCIKQHAPRHASVRTRWSPSDLTCLHPRTYQQVRSGYPVIESLWTIRIKSLARFLPPPSPLRWNGTERLTMCNAYLADLREPSRLKASQRSVVGRACMTRSKPFGRSLPIMGRVQIKAC